MVSNAQARNAVDEAILAMFDELQAEVERLSARLDRLAQYGTQRRYGRYHDYAEVVHILRPIELDRASPDYGDPNTDGLCGRSPRGVWRSIDTRLRPTDRLCAGCREAAHENEA